MTIVCAIATRNQKAIPVFFSGIAAVFVAIVLIELNTEDTIHTEQVETDPYEECFPLVTKAGKERMICLPSLYVKE